MTQHLKLDENFGGAGDAFYEALLESHSGLSDTESDALNARLVLILANQIGDLNILRAALRHARASIARNTQIAHADLDSTK